MKINWSKTLFLRDFALFNVLIILAFFLATIWVVYETYDDHAKLVSRQMETEATRIDRAMILEIEHSSYLLESLGRQMTHMDTKNLNNVALLLRSFDTTATLHHVFSWIDESNHNVVSSNQGVHSPIDVSDRDFIKKTTYEAWKISVGNPIQGRVSAKWVLPIALGVTDETGKYIGTILISMDINTITRNLRSAVKDSGIIFTVYSNNFLPLTQTIDKEEINPLDAYSEQLKKISLDNRKSGLLANASLFDSNSIFVYYELSANYPYIIMLGFDNKESLLLFKSLLVPRLIEILIIGIFMLTLLSLVRRRIIQPISELSLVSNDIIKGNSFNAPRNRGGMKEINILAHQIKRLSDYIHEIKLIEQENSNKNLMLKKQKDDLELNNRIKLDFLIAMSHELRTPLNTIIGFAETLKTKPDIAGEDASYIENIYSSAKQLQFLVGDVQEIAKIENGNHEAHEKPLDVRFVISKAIKLVTIPAEQLNIELKTPNFLPKLLMNEAKLREIIRNLILNIASKNGDNKNIIINVYLQKDKTGSENLFIVFTDSGAKSGAAKPSKTTLGSLSIPLLKSLVAMSHANLETKTNPATFTLIFPEEKLVY